MPRELDGLASLGLRQHGGADRDHGWQPGTRLHAHEHPLSPRHDVHPGSRPREAGRHPRPLRQRLDVLVSVRRRLPLRRPRHLVVRRRDRHRARRLRAGGGNARASRPSPADGERAVRPYCRAAARATRIPRAPLRNTHAAIDRRSARGLRHHPRRFLPSCVIRLPRQVSRFARCPLPAPSEKGVEYRLHERGQPRAVVLVPELADRLGLRGVGMDHPRERAEPDLTGHRDRDLGDHVARMRGDDRRAEDLIALLGHVHLDEPLRLAVEDRAVDFLEALDERADRDAALLGVALGEPDVRDLGLGVRAPGHDERARLRVPEEERVLDHQARLEVGVVRELEGRGDVAARVDVRVRRHEMIVDLDAGADRVLDADLLEIEPLDVRRAADTDHDLVGLDRLAALQVERLRAPRRLRGPLDRLAARDPHTVALERAEDDVRGVAILLDEDLRRDLDEMDLRAEPRERLRELAADRSRADDGEAARKRRQRKDRLVREVTGLLEAGDRRGRGARAGRDHRARETEALAADLDDVVAGETSRAEEHVDAETAKALGGVEVRDVRTEPAEALHHSSEIRARAGRHLDPERARVAHRGGRAGGAEERLRRHAPDVQTVAAHEVALDERDLGPEPGGAGRGDEAGRAGAEDHEVVTRRRFRVGPLGRMDARGEPLIVLVERLERGRARRFIHGSSSLGDLRVERAAGDPRHAHRDGDGGDEPDRVERPFRRRARASAGTEHGEVSGDRAEVHVHQRSGDHADRRREQVISEAHAGDPEEIVQQIEREHRREAHEPDDLPALGGDRFVDRAEAPSPAICRATQSRARYRPTRNAAAEPSVAPSHATGAPLTTPKTAPAPSVRIAPGSRNTHAAT